MKEVEHFLWMLPPDPWRKRPSPSTYMMDAETAQARHPGATPILITRVVRQVCETYEETSKVMLADDKLVFPPKDWER